MATLNSEGCVKMLNFLDYVKMDEIEDDINKLVDQLKNEHRDNYDNLIRMHLSFLTDISFNE